MSSRRLLPLPRRYLALAAAALLLSGPFYTQFLVEASSSTISSPSSTTTSSLPRSKSSRWGHHGSSENNHHNHNNNNYPPWNPSPRIQPNGFLKDAYPRIPGEWESEVRYAVTRQPLDTKCRIRQVPGDGNCLFHSISLCLQHAVNGTHWEMSSSSSSSSASSSSSSKLKKSECNDSLDALYVHSNILRQRAVEVLRSPRQRLFLQGRDVLKSHELVEAAAQQYGLSSEEYCEAMQQDCVWGGGPEIVALSNILKRPIHVYELCSANNGGGSHGRSAANCFVLRRMACFGSPRFDRKQALHILSADSRFPDLVAGEQAPLGNHFLAVFPMRRPRPRRLRGGSSSSSSSSDQKGNNHDYEADEDNEDDDDHYWIDWEASSEESSRGWSLWNWWRQLLL